ncbi:MAG: hypothetical protein HY810_10605 [Candidatus Omnitrophica bacterium]|nr:hypothetical protein [Candidatus Omnitrophota bacterium]
MKNFRIIMIIFGGIFIGLCSLLIFFIIENSKLKAEKDEKTKLIQEAVNIDKEVEKIRDEIDKLNLEKNNVDKMIPENETGPFIVIKEATYLSRQSGIRKVEIDYGAKDQNLPAVLAQLMSREEDTGTLLTPIPALVEGVKQFIIGMNFEATFAQSLDFFEAVLSLERIFIIESIKIERVKEIFPNQRVTLVLTAYTF